MLTSLHSALKLTLDDFMAKCLLHFFGSLAVRDEILCCTRKKHPLIIKKTIRKSFYVALIIKNSLFYSIAIPEKRSNNDRNPFLHQHLSLISSLLIIRESAKRKNHRDRFEVFYLHRLLHGDNLLHFNSFCLLITRLFLRPHLKEQQSVNASNIYKSNIFFIIC